jgi:hypothetical protein
MADSGDGGVLAIRADDDYLDADESRRSIVRVGADGTVADLVRPRVRPAGPLGNGDGLPLFRDELPAGDEHMSAFALAGDGSLFIARDAYDQPGTGLRALVPPDSPRPRVALTQQAFAIFGLGRVGFGTSVPGSVSVVARSRAATVTGRGVAVAGNGELTLDSVPPPGRYTVRVRLTTTSGRAETRALIDTRPVLPVREGRAEVTSAYAYSDGDEGGHMGTQVGDCHRREQRVIRCLLLFFESSHELWEPELGRWSLLNEPVAWVTATLRNDGVQTSFRRLPGADYETKSCLRVISARHPHVGGTWSIRVRVRARCAGRVRVAAQLRWGVRGQVRRAVFVSTRTMRSSQTWRSSLWLPRRVVTAVRAGRRVRGEVIVRALRPSRYGPIPEEHGIPVFLHR